jgi:serine/threonine-protein kinase RsbW
MPLLGRNGTSIELLGIVLGHGAIVLEENDLLEMDRFLNIVGAEIITLLRSGGLIESRNSWLHEGEYLIPETPREKAIKQIIEFTKPFLAQERDAFWLRLAMDEAISNAIVHGNFEPLTMPVTNLSLKYHISEEQITLTVRDNGQGFDFSNVPDPTAEENLLSINGRGIYLMRRIMDMVSFNECGNQVTMIKKFDGSPLNPF